MKRVLACLMLTALVTVAGAEAQKKNSKSPKKSEWKQLFNGRDLDGWEMVGKGRFVVEDGLLRTEGNMGLLWYTREKFGDCTIRVVYKTSNPASNSGVFIRIADKPKDEWVAVHHGYEVQICDNQDEYHRTGAIYSLSKSSPPAAKPTGEWNTMDITLAGERVIVHLNGVKVNEFDPNQPVPERKQSWEPERGPRPAFGYIGLQNHDDNATEHVYFKEVSVRKP